MDRADLIAAIADFIRRYREAEQPPKRMLEAVLGCFPQADAVDFDRALALADRRRAVA